MYNSKAEDFELVARPAAPMYVSCCLWGKLGWREWIASCGECWSALRGGESYDMFPLGRCSVSILSCPGVSSEVIMIGQAGGFPIPGCSCKLM